MQGSVATRRRVQVTGRRVTGVKLRECVASCDAGIPVARTCPAGSATHVDPTRHCPNGTDMLHPGLRRGCMTPDDRWLAAVWPFVRRQLPSAPARVLEVGCGPLGGFVPALLEDGYKAVGVDPEAPEGSDYQQVEVERHDPPWPVDCVVASTSLHHVADLDEVLDRLEALLVPGGVLVVVEWAWERFDEATARWCFARLTPPAPGEEPGWLHKHRARWAASGRPWENYCRTWAEHEGLHPGEEILRGLDARFDRQLYVEGPYFFADLADRSAEPGQQLADRPSLRWRALWVRPGWWPPWRTVPGGWSSRRHR